MTIESFQKFKVKCVTFLESNPNNVSTIPNTIPPKSDFHRSLLYHPNLVYSRSVGRAETLLYRIHSSRGSRNNCWFIMSCERIYRTLLPYREVLKTARSCSIFHYFRLSEKDTNSHPASQVNRQPTIHRLKGTAGGYKTVQCVMFQLDRRDFPAVFPPLNFNPSEM